MKIIITYAYAGIGHKKAAQAIHQALTKRKGVDLQLIDVLDYASALFKFLYPSIYLFLINRVSVLWGFFYYLLDLKLVDLFLAPGRKFFHNFFAKDFIGFVLKENPDAVICTHFLPAEVVSGLKRRGIFKGKLITVITDFLPHYFWFAKHSDYFVVALEKTKKELVRRGIEEERIKVLGIPCESKFSISKHREMLLEKLGLENGFFNLLIMRGGFGAGPIEKIVDCIASLEPEIRDKVQLIVICGKNKNLFKKLTDRGNPPIRHPEERSDEGSHDIPQHKIRYSVFGYMDNIDEFMEISDCIIAKPGGLTISEALSKKLPMIMIEPIPGQETRNCKILTGYGCAVRANRVGEIKDYVRDFIKFPEKVIGMKARICLLAYPEAAENIAEFVVNYR